MKKFTLLLLSVFASLMSWAQADVITSVPEGGDTLTFFRSGKCYYAKPYMKSDSTTTNYTYEGEQGGSMEVVKVGNDLYLKDPLYGLVHDTYVKGSLSEDGTKITVSLPQNLYWDERYNAYVQLRVGSLVNGKIWVNEDITSITYTLAEDGVTFVQDSLTNELPLCAFWSDNDEFGGLGEWETSLELYIEKLNVVTLPEGVTATEMPFEGIDMSTGRRQTINGNVMVGMDGDTIYVQGLVPMRPEAWAKGVVRNGVARFPIQFLNYDVEDKMYYLAGLSGDGKNMSTFTMTYDKELNSYAADGRLMVTSSDLEYTAETTYGYYTGLYIGNRPQLVQVPEGLKTEKMGFEGLYDNGDRELSKAGIVEVGYTGEFLGDNEDVYMRGLLSEAPDTWIKGKFDDVRRGASFAYGQYVGYDDNGNIYVVGETPAIFGFKSSDPSSIEFAFDSEKKTFRLLNGIYASRKKAAITYGSMLEAGLMINEGDLWIASANGYENAQSVDQIVLSEGVTGKLDAGGNSNDPKYYDLGESLRMYAKNTLTIQSPEERPITKVVFVMNGNENQMNLEANTGKYQFSGNVGTWTGESSEIVFSVPDVKGYQARIQSVIVFYINYGATLVTVPDDVIVDPYELKGVYDPNNWVDEPADTTLSVYVGIQGEDVYFRGLSLNIPDAWVKGKLVDGQVTIPSWSMGSFEKPVMVGSNYTYTVKAKFGAATNFVYENGVFKIEKYTIENPEAQGELDVDIEVFTNVTLTKKASVAGTPIAPTLNEFVGVGPNRYVSFTIPQMDVVDSLYLTSDDLYYVIWVERDGLQLQLELDQKYYELAENMVEIPFTFTNANISKSRISLLQGTEMLQSWTKIGVQSIYRGGGEEHVTEIDWKDLTEYWELVGISEVGMGETAATYYDLQGRQAGASAKGLLIKKIRLSDGSLKTVKVMRK